MPVNGWLGLAYGLRGSPDGDLEEDRRERWQLRRAVRIARQTGPVPTAAPAAESHSGSIRRDLVEAQQAILRHALRTGEVDLVRQAGRTLRLRDFAGDPGMVEGLLGVMRDARSSDGEILEAAAQLVTLCPAWA